MSDGGPASPAGLVELSLEEEWPRLRAQLELRDTTWLSFVFCSSPEQARELLDRAQSQLRAAGREITVVPATEPAAVVTLIDALMRATAPAASVTWVDGLATRVKRRDAAMFWEQALLRANDHRDALLRRHGDGLVFCLPTELKTVVRETAPDLWAKRVLAMEVDPPLQLFPIPENRLIEAPAGPTEEIVVAPPLDAKVAQRNRVLVEDLRRARALRAAGNDVEAGRLLESALARDAPPNERAQALTELAEAREAQGDVPGAIRALEEALWMGGLTRRQLERAIDRLEDLAEREGRPELAAAAAAAHVSLLRDGEASSLAASLNRLWYRLTEVGRHEDALAASEEAVTLYRSLADARHETFIPELARSLNSLSIALSRLGRNEDALAAIQESSALRRALAQTRPDDYIPELARSLNNLSVVLSQLGRSEDGLEAAEESVALYRVVAEARPDEFRSSLVRALNNLARSLAAVGRREDAMAATEESVALWRAMAQVRPEAGSRGLASSLGNLSNALVGLGRHQDALAAVEESVKLYRSLAEARPALFLPDLARALKILSISLSNDGRTEDALAASDESTALYRALAEVRPDAFLPDLASSLNNLANRLSDLGRGEDALSAIAESVALDRLLTEAHPDTFVSELAGALNNLSNRLSDLGRQEDALAAIEESATLWRAASEARPDTSVPDLAMALNNLSVRLAERGRLEEALEAAEEAVRVILPKLERAPYLLPDAGVRLARRYAEAAEAAGDVVDDELWRKLQAVTRLAPPTGEPSGGR